MTGVSAAQAAKRSTHGDKASGVPRDDLDAINSAWNLCGTTAFFSGLVGRWPSEHVIILEESLSEHFCWRLFHRSPKHDGQSGPSCGLSGLACPRHLA